MNQANLNPYMTFMGHLPELCFGIFLASRDKFKLPWWAFLLALVILVGGNIYQWLWPFANLAAAVILVVSIQGLIGIKARIKGFYSLLSAIGVISMYLFAVHGYLRSPFLELANTLGNSIASLLIGILFVTVACGLAAMLMHTESAARRWIASPSNRKRAMAKLLLMVSLVVGGFALLFFWDYRKQDEITQTKEVIAFESSHDFEESIPGRYDLFSDSVVYQGERSLILDNSRAFSPGFIVDFDSVNLAGVYEVEISAWLFTTEAATSLHLAMEIWDKPSGIQVEWQSEYIKPGTYQTTKWFQRTLHYSIPVELRRTNYYMKVYAWKPSSSTWYVDELRLRVKARI